MSHPRQCKISAWVLFLFVILYGALYLSRAYDPHWSFTGDTSNGVGLMAHQISAFHRGEYPAWNPLVRTGQREPEFHVILTGNPIFNFSALLSFAANARDMVFAWAQALYLFAIFYVAGIYVLLRYLTGSPWAGTFGGILAIGSSSSVFINLHFEFILIVHAIPWLIYGFVAYWRKGHLRYLFIIAIASIAFLHGYEFVMGLLFLLFLLIGLGLFHGFGSGKLAAGLGRIKQLPVTHISIGAVLALILLVPNLFLFVEFLEQLALTRLANLNVTENFGLTFDKISTATFIDYAFRPKFWISLFSGAVFTDFNELQYLVGALVPALAGTAILSPKYRKPALIFTFAGLMIFLSNIYPLRILLGFFPFSLIHNGGFLYQLALFAMVIVASLGFAAIYDSPARQWFGRLAILFLVFLALWLGAQFIFSPLDRSHNVLLILAGGAATISMIATVKWVATERLGLVMTVIASLYTGLALAAYDRLPIAGAYLEDAEAYAAYRYRDGHGLIFKHTRPKEIEVIPTQPQKIPADFTENLQHEFSSFLTRRDNSYLPSTLPQPAAFPQEIPYFLFRSLAGHEGYLAGKFHFATRALTSSDRSDMSLFNGNSTLLGDIRNAGVAVVDRVAGKTANYGNLTAANLKKALDGAAKAQVQVQAQVVDYNANSARFKVASESAGLLIYTDLWNSGWRVSVNGQPAPLIKAFHTFKAVEIGAGVSDVLFEYRSRAHDALVLMNITWLLLVLVLGLILLRRKAQY